MQQHVDTLFGSITGYVRNLFPKKFLYCYLSVGSFKFPLIPEYTKTQPSSSKQSSQTNPFVEAERKESNDAILSRFRDKTSEDKISAQLKNLQDNFDASVQFIPPSQEKRIEVEENPELQPSISKPKGGRIAPAQNSLEPQKFLHTPKVRQNQRFYVDRQLKPLQIALLPPISLFDRAKSAKSSPIATARRTPTKSKNNELLVQFPTAISGFVGKNAISFKLPELTVSDVPKILANSFEKFVKVLTDIPKRKIFFSRELKLIQARVQKHREIFGPIVDIVTALLKLLQKLLEHFSPRDVLGRIIDTLQWLVYG